MECLLHQVSSCISNASSSIKHTLIPIAIQKKYFFCLNPLNSSVYYYVPLDSCSKLCILSIYRIISHEELAPGSKANKYIIRQGLAKQQQNILEMLSYMLYKNFIFLAFLAIYSLNRTTTKKYWWF